MPNLLQVAGDGYSILDKAVMEHNLIAIGRIYENICITEVATILGLEPEKAEKVLFMILLLRIFYEYCLIATRFLMFPLGTHRLFI